MDYGIRPTDRSRWQGVLNASWPPPEVARRLHDRPDAIDALVRVVFEREGEVWLEGRATRWHERHVCVYVVDPRLAVPYVWVDAADVKRR